MDRVETATHGHDTGLHLAGLVTTLALPLMAVATVPPHKHGWATPAPAQWVVAGVSVLAVVIVLLLRIRRTHPSRVSSLQEYGTAQLPLGIGFVLAMSGWQGGLVAVLIGTATTALILLDSLFRRRA